MDGKELNLNSEYARLYFKDKAEKKAEKKMTNPLKMFVPESVGELYDEVNFKNKQNNNEFLNQIINIIINDYQNIIQNSEEIFENRLKEDGWAEDIGEGAVKIWNLFTCGDWEGHTASKIREDFQMAQVYIEELKAAQKSGSAEQLNETFKKIYGKNFDKETIDKYLEENKKYTDITVSYAELEEYKSKTNTLRNGDSYTKAMDYNYSESNFNIDMENLNEHIKLYEDKMKSFYEKRGINIDFEQIYQKAGVYEEEQEYPEKPKDGFKTDDEKREYWLKCMDIKVANKQRLKKLPSQPATGFKTPQEYQKYFFECKDIKRRNENCKNYKKFCALRNFANQQNEMFSNILKDKYKTMGIEGNDFKQMYLSAKKKNDKAYENAFGSTNKLMKTVTEYQNAQKFRGEFVKGVGLFAGTMLTAGTLGAPMAAATTSFLVESSNQMTSGMKKSVDGYGVKSFGKALGEKIKKEGLSSVIKDVAVKGLENIKFKENGINAATVGAVTIVIGGTGYLVDNISKFAGASKLTSAIYSGISEIGAGVGTEYALTGEVTVKGTVYVVLFTITGKVLSLIPKTQNPIKDLQKMIEGDSALKELGKTIDWKNLSKKDLKTILNAMSNAYYPIREGVGNSQKFIAYNAMLDACKLKLAGKWIVQDMANPKKALPAPESSANPEIMPKAQTSVSAENSAPVSTAKVVPKQNSPAMRALTPQPIKGSVEPVVTTPKVGVNLNQNLPILPSESPFSKQLSASVVKEFNPVALFEKGIYGEKNYFMLFSNDNMTKLLKASGNKKIIDIVNELEIEFKKFNISDSDKVTFYLENPIIKKYISNIFKIKDLPSQPTFYRMVSKSEIENLLKQKVIKPNNGRVKICLTEEPIGNYGQSDNYRITFNHNIDNRLNFSKGNCGYRMGLLESYSLDDIAAIEEIVDINYNNDITLKPMKASMTQPVIDGVAPAAQEIEVANELNKIKAKNESLVVPTEDTSIPVQGQGTHHITQDTVVADELSKIKVKNESLVVPTEDTSIPVQGQGTHHITQDTVVADELSKIKAKNESLVVPTEDTSIPVQGQGTHMVQDTVVADELSKIKAKNESLVVPTEDTSISVQSQGVTASTGVNAVTSPATTERALTTQPVTDRVGFVTPKLNSGVKSAESNSDIPIEIKMGTVSLVERAAINEQIIKLVKDNGIKGKDLQNVISQIANEAVVAFRDKSELLPVMRKQFSEIKKTDSDIYVLNIRDPKSKRGTSYEYISKWYAEANDINSNRLINIEQLQNIINESPSNVITFVIPDDVALSGRSLIIDTISAFDGIKLNGKKINIVISPVASTASAKNGINAFARHDVEKMQPVLNSQDKNNGVVEKFFETYGNDITITSSENTRLVKPFYETDSYIKLTKEKPVLADIIRRIFIMNNEKQGYGFGRTGQNGLVIVMPGSDGKTLKSPNNNCIGGEAYSMAYGVKPSDIRKPNNFKNTLMDMSIFINFDKYLNGFFSKWFFKK